jgi:hypothetical protein
MKRKFLVKTLAMGIIVLFIGISVTSALGISNLLDDTTAPVTTISFDPAEPNGCNGWYISNVTITLNATDDISGVNATYYRINESDWNEYISPFIISEEGKNILIEFYSIDNAGNVETVKLSTLDIDKTPPKGTFEWKIRKIGCWKWEITFYINITNETSGMERTEFYLNGVLQVTLTGPGPTYSWIIIIYGRPPKIEIKTVIYDMACNNASFIFNESDFHSRPRINSIALYSNHIWLMRFFDKFLLFQNFLNILRWYN